MASRGMDSKVTVYKKNGQVYMREVYDIGALPKDRIYELTESDKGIKLQREGDERRDEYFIINQKGNLEFWSENNNYYTAPKFGDISPELIQLLFLYSYAHLDLLGTSLQPSFVREHRLSWPLLHMS